MLNPRWPQSERKEVVKCGDNILILEKIKKKIEKIQKASDKARKTTTE